MKTELQLVRALSDGKFHSGEALGSALNLSRSAIWKAMTKLEELNIEVYRVKRRGYKLPNPIELLDEHEIKPFLKAPISIEILPTIGSTNDYCLQLARRRVKAPYAVLSEHQSAGRGRHNREWESPFGRNIYLSLLWQFQQDPSELSGLSLAIGVTIAQALQGYGINELQLKWPNDVLWQKKKLAGVLVDIVAESHHQTQVVIGIGLNLMASTAHKDQWTNLQTITGQQPQRNRIAGVLLNQLLENLPLFSIYGLSPFLPIWRQLDALSGRKITITTIQGEQQGIGIGIGDHGEFIYEISGERRSALNGTVKIL